MSSIFHSHKDHPPAHRHSSPDHQHGALHDSSAHSPLSHHHNHPVSPTHHTSLLHTKGKGAHPDTLEPSSHDPIIMSDRDATDTGLSSSQHDTQHPDPSGKTAYTSSDPTTSPAAPSTSKVTGDLKGMAQGVAGSVQAAVGTTLGQKAMAEKGFEKMSAEDARLAAKKGSPPVGSTHRSTTTTADAGQAD